MFFIKDKNLYFLIYQYQNKNDDDSLLLVLEKFNPLIKKYARKLAYDGAQTDLIIYFMELLKKLPLNKQMKEDKYILGYISTSIKNHYIKLNKSYYKILISETELNLDLATPELMIYNLQNDFIENKIVINLALSKLSECQKQIIIDKFFNQKTDIEISQELNISRQAINKTKNKALNNMKNYLIGVQ